MRHLLFLAAAVCAAETPAPKTVYLLPMSGGLDQFVAARLTREGVFRVVTDPKGAEAVLVDRLGEGFEQRMMELYKGAVTEEKDAKKDERPRNISFGRGRGTVFLVDVHSREVIWSAYEKPKNVSPDELHRTAGRIVGRLKKDLTGK